MFGAQRLHVVPSAWNIDPAILYNRNYNIVPVSQVYQEPLAAALSSNRAILSFTDVQLILSPVAQLLELNRCVHARLLLWRVCVCVL